MSMSGYTLIPGIIMGGIARRTATHYASGGRGNYGAWGLLDWVSGTSVGKDMAEDIQDEADKHQVKERGQKAVSDTGSIMQEGIDGLRKGRKSRKRNDY